MKIIIDIPDNHEVLDQMNATYQQQGAQPGMEVLAKYIRDRAWGFILWNMISGCAREATLRDGTVVSIEGRFGR